MDIELISIVEAHPTSENAREVLADLVILERGGQYAVARRDFRANQWANPNRSTTIDKTASLVNGWAVASLQSNLANAQRWVRSILGEQAQASTEWAVGGGV